MTDVLLEDGQVRVETPNGGRVWYDDASHGYYRCKPDGSRGTRYTAVTTVSKVFDVDPSRLLGWAVKTQLVGVAELYRGSTEYGWLADEQTMWRVLEAHKLTWEDVRNRAGARGTDVHRLVFEALARGEDPWTVTMTAEEQGYAAAVVKFWADEAPAAQLVEQIVFSDRLGVAGRLDFFGRIAGRDGRGVVDLKTGRFLSASAHVQVGGGYPLLLEESGWPSAEWAMMLQVDADGEYRLVEAEGTREDFELAVAAYRAAGRINSAAGRARKARDG